MSIIYMDGMDYYGNVTDYEANTAHTVVNNGALSVETSGGRFGDGTVVISGEGTSTIDIPLNSQTTVRMGFAFLQQITDGQTDVFMTFVGSNGSTAVEIHFENDGQNINFTYNDTGVSQVFSYASDTWYWMEFEIVHADSGSFRFFVDNEEKVNLTGIDTTNKSGYNDTSDINKIRIEYSESYDVDTHKFDDIIIWNNDGQGVSSFPIYDSRIVTQRPSGVGSSSEFTPNGDSDIALTIDESPGPDFDTTYNSSSTVGARDLVTVGSIPNVDYQSILATQLTSVAKKTDTGTRTHSNVLLSGATTDVSTAQSLSTKYEHKKAIYETNPDTGSAWTESEVNSVEIGYEIGS